MKTNFLSLCIILITSISLFSQNNVAGKVLSAEDDMPLIGASVSISGTSEGTITDENGMFQLSTSQAFPFKLMVSYVGFTPNETEVTGPGEVTIYLEEGLMIGEELVISASRKAERTSEAPASISVMEARRIESQALSNPAQALRNLHGVDVSQQGVDHFQITLRGRNTAFTTETYYMKDFRNIVVPGQGQIALGRTSLNDLDLERIEVVRGPGSALYGPGVESGVVHFISKSASKYQGTSFSVGTGTQSNISFAGRHAQKINDKWAYKIVGRFDQADDFVLDPDDPTDAESLSMFAPQVVSGLTGELLRTSNPLEEQIRSYSLMSELEYSYDDNTTFYLNGGYTHRRGIVRADLGEALQDYGNYFAQLKMTSKNWFAQVYMNGVKDDTEESVLYRTGLTSISKYQSYQGQVQYDWPVIEDKWEVNLGSEIQWLRSDTEGTVHGRFENDDNFDIYSGYVQSTYAVTDKLDFLVAGRVDRFTALEESTFSPRAALIYKPVAAHSFRMSYNRSVSAPSALFVFADIPFGVTPAFDIQFLGGIQPLEFSDPLVTQSFLGIGEYPGTDLSMTVPYAIAVAGLEGTVPPDLIDYLNSKIGEVSGVSTGLLFNNGNPVTVLPERDKIRSTKTNAYEIGYSGVFGNNISVGLDVYYNRKKDLIFSAPVTPVVLYPNLSADLVGVLNSVTTDAELAAFGFDQQTLGGIFTAIGDGLAENALGLVAPNVEYNSVLPTFIVTPTNTGEVEYFGVDFNMQYYFNDNLTAFANYSWISQNFFNDDEIGLDGTGQTYALNTPKNRIRLGADYIPEGKGFSYGLSARYQDEMEVQSGTIFAGTLEAYTIVDASVGYNFGNGIRLNMTAQNVLDDEYRVMPRMPKIGRLVLLKAVFDL